MNLYKTHWNAIMFISDLFFMKKAFLFPGATLYKIAILVNESFYDSNKSD